MGAARPNIRSPYVLPFMISAAASNAVLLPHSAAEQATPGAMQPLEAAGSLPVLHRSKSTRLWTKGELCAEYITNVTCDSHCWCVWNSTAYSESVCMTNINPLACPYTGYGTDGYGKNNGLSGLNSFNTPPRQQNMTYAEFILEYIVDNANKPGFVITPALIRELGTNPAYTSMAAGAGSNGTEGSAGDLAGLGAAGSTEWCTYASSVCTP